MNNTMPPPPDNGQPSPDVLWQGLADCPEEAFQWAALGYRCGLVDGRAQVFASIADAGAQAARAARPILARPTFAELQQRRYGGAK